MECPDCPLDLEYLWLWFQRLSITRPITMSGAGYITETEIHAFCLNRQIEPAVWELDLLARLDVLFLDSLHKPKPKKET